MAFEDIYGYEEIKRKLLELKGWYDRRKEYASKGIDLPHGLLLSGPAGCGKSLFAGEFAQMIDSHPIVITDKKGITKKFELARKESKEKGIVKVVMIDEIDLIVYQDLSTEREILSGIDGFNKEGFVFTIATTNGRFESSTQLLRCGRFDYRLYISSPNRKDRMTLIKSFFKKYGIPVDGLDFDYLLSITNGSSCAGIKLMCNTIRLKLDPNYSPERIENVITESLRLSYTLTEKEDRCLNIAIHEAGHAYLTAINDKAIHFFRSMLCAGDCYGGITLTNTDSSKDDYEKEYAQMKICLAGQLAEEVVINHHGMGASEDYRAARLIASTLVGDYGYGRGAADIMPPSFSPGQVTEEKHRAVELQYEALLSKAEADTKEIISAHTKEIQKIADILMDKGVVTRKEVFTIIGMK